MNAIPVTLHGPRKKAAPPRDRICIAILALGGQGGGVLADWIQHVALKAGWLAQGTSVPGVAQRTGSTVYYVELGRMHGARAPVMAQMPVPGDVDIVFRTREKGKFYLKTATEFGSNDGNAVRPPSHSPPICVS